MARSARRFRYDLANLWLDKVEMCGIVGFSWKDEKLLREMMAAVEHRGPDELGYYLDERVSLGHQRLKKVAII